MEERKGLSAEFIVQILFTSAQFGERWVMDVDKKLKYPEYRFGIVMEAAKRNLMVVLLQERISIKDTQEIIRWLVKCTGHLHSNGKIHADLKPLNAVRMSDKTWRLIDFDGAIPFSGLVSQTVALRF